MEAKEKLRRNSIEEQVGADSILIASPMWNWNLPSVLKAYVDQLIYPGKLDTYTKSLAGKSVTALVACGGSHGEGSWHPEWDFSSRYIRTVFGKLGSSDVEAEYCLAGVAPGMETLLPKKEESMTLALDAVSARVAVLKLLGVETVSPGSVKVSVEKPVAIDPTPIPPRVYTDDAPVAPAGAACCIISQSKWAKLHSCSFRCCYFPFTSSLLSLQQLVTLLRKEF